MVVCGSMSDRGPKLELSIQSLTSRLGASTPGFSKGATYALEPENPRAAAIKFNLNRLLTIMKLASRGGEMP
jgi:hypothetical protein